MEKKKDAFVEALENAKAVIEDGDAMEADVVEADQQLLRAADALIKKGDKTSLQKLVDSTADYKKENYLSAGWNTFMKQHLMQRRKYLQMSLQHRKT